MEYNWLKAFHIFFVICWMAGLFYLPRLFVYHSNAKSGGELDETLKIQENKLLKIIMMPAMILTWIFGLSLVFLHISLHREVWFSLKLFLVLGLSSYHGYLGLIAKKFRKGERPHSASFFRLLNEVPTISVFLIIVLVVVKPFSA